MGNSDQMPLVLSILAVILAVIALILGSVSISHGNMNFSNNNGSATGATSAQQELPEGVINPNDDKIWIMSIGHDSLHRGEYLDEVSGTIKGFNVDIVNAVCQIANKNCRFSADVYSRCWDSSVGQSQRGGEGLFKGYYDACTAWSQNYIRTRTFQFSKPFAKVWTGGFFTKTDNPDGFDWTDIRGKKIGFIDGFAFDEFCIARTNIMGKEIPPELIVHYTNRDDLFNGVKNGDIDAAFAGIQGVGNPRSLGLTVVNIDNPVDICLVTGFSMMMRKESDMWKWFNPALESLMATTSYRSICNELTETHGHIPGSDPEDICIGYS